MRNGPIGVWPRTGATSVLLLLGLGMPSIGISSREGPPPILDPKRYTSPSTRYVLEVDPTDPQGMGAGKYRFMRDGEELWSGERPFTFWDAIVTDDGKSIGYAYLQGIRGEGESDEFVVAVLGEEGELRARHARRRGPIVSCPPARVSAVGLFLHASADRVVVRMHDDGLGSQESWWTLRLSDGTELESLDPARSLSRLGEHRMLGGAVALTGTPLILVHWVRGLRDAVLALLDADERPVWVLDLPGDYVRQAGGMQQSSLWAWTHEGRAIANGPASGQFDIRSVADSKRTRFEATRDATAETGWRVREIASDADPISFEDSPDPTFPTVRLREVGRVVLASDSEHPPPPIRDVSAFDFDEEGLFEVIRKPASKDRGFSWCHVDRSGSLQREIEFPRFGSDEALRFHWLRISNQRWLVTESGFGIGSTAKAWWADTRSGSIDAIEGFDSPPVESLARDPRGGFVVLGEVHWEYGAYPILTSFDLDGRSRWSIGWERKNDPRVPTDPGSLFAPHAIAVTADGITIVVDSIRKTLQLFDPTGRFDRTISLEQAWGEARYPGHVIATTDRKILVHDSGGDLNSIWRMDLDGGAATRTEPRHPDGHKPPPYGGSLRVAPDGRLWTTDRQMLERLGPDGAVDEIVGNMPGQDAPTEVEDPFVDSLGRILTLDRRNRIVLVFDREGRVLARCQFDATDEFGRHPFTDAGDGSVLARAQDSQYVRFDAQGARLGREKLSTEPRIHRCYFQPRTTRRWLLAGYVGGIVNWGDGVDGSGDRPPINRRPDGRWLRNILSMVVGEDGTLFIHDGSTIGPPDVPSSISIFPLDGSPGQSIDLPARGFGDDLAVLAGWFAIGTGKEVFLVERDGKKILRAEFGTPGDKNKWIEPFASPDGRELWLIEPPTRTLVRYALP